MKARLEGGLPKPHHTQVQPQRWAHHGLATKVCCQVSALVECDFIVCSRTASVATCLTRAAADLLRDRFPDARDLRYRFDRLNIAASQCDLFNPRSGGLAKRPFDQFVYPGLPPSAAKNSAQIGMCVLI